MDLSSDTSMSRTARKNKCILNMQPMSFLFTSDFKAELLQVLREYSGTDLSLMISGGSLLTCLDDERYSALDTSRWTVFYSDERVDQDQLNYTASLPFIGRMHAAVCRIHSSMPDAAEEYSKVLRDVDVCLLGIGVDGHICSLLPNCAELDSKELVVSLEGLFPVSRRRISVTLRFINERVSRLYFVVPNSRLKGISMPHRSIVNRIKREFVVILESS